MVLEPQPADALFKKAPGRQSRLRSPDGKWRLRSRDGELSVEKIGSGKSTKLLEPAAKREIHVRGFRWSPDGKHVLFVQSDTTDVKKRTILLPTDPTYPGTASHRFARVGGKIEQRKIGVATLETGKVWWLPIEMPEEGFYLGQLEWAGNSNEILVEWFSRFRDRREFLLVSLGGEAKKIFSETNEAWVVASQAKNHGLIWIGERSEQCIIISEKDGWRHACLLYTSPSPRDATLSRMPSSA